MAASTSMMFTTAAAMIKRVVSRHSARASRSLWPTLRIIGNPLTRRYVVTPGSSPPVLTVLNQAPSLAEDSAAGRISVPPIKDLSRGTRAIRVPSII